jgi:site-specific recombinase
VRQIRPGLIGATSNPNTNLLHLIEEIKVANALRIEMVPRLQEFLISRDYVTAITETGLTLDSGVFSELFQRIEYNLLPKPVENANILSFFNRLFDSRTDADWLERIDKDRFSELLQLLIPDYRPILDALAPQLFMSLEILSLKLAGLGYDPIVADRIR